MKKPIKYQYLGTNMSLSIHSFDQQISIPYFAPGQHTGVTVVNKIFTCHFANLHIPRIYILMN